MSEQPSDIDSIFMRAIEIDSPQQRDEYLRTACRDDAALLARLQKLLSAHFKAGPFLETPVPGLPPDVSDELTVGAGVGPYRLLEQIGEGGMGVVFRAHQTHPVQRDVALKIIKLGMDTKQVIARFDAERQALAVMDHPHIAKVYDAGATATGRPFFVMELVGGEPVTTFCDHHNLAINQRLELFSQVCRAVQHAHQKGLIHRDIKPSNVLASIVDGAPAAKVIDFGIAKATDARMTEKTLFTEDRQLIGTPQYMSPEQAEGSLDIDTRSDIYSLGVLLYELLTGATPFDPKQLRSAAYGEMQRIIREVEPPHPSTRLSQNRDTLASVAAMRRIEPRKLTQTVRGELDWIVMKAMEKDRARRYESAAALAADIMHHLADEPVLAGPPSRIYRLRKFVRRHRVEVIAASLIALLLVGGITGTTIGLLEARKQRDQARLQEENATQQAAIAEAVSAFQSDMLASADPGKLLGDKVTVFQAVSAAIRELDEGKLNERPLVEASVRDIIGNTLRALGRYDAAEPNLRKAVELRRRHLSAGAWDTSRAIDSLAKLLLEQARFGEAEALLRESLAICRATHPAIHRDTAVCLGNLAAVLSQQRKMHEAEPLLREAVEVYRKVHPAGHWEIASGVNNLALLLHRQGKFAEAEPLYRESVSIRRAALPAGHPRIADGLGNLAEVLRDQDKLTEAEALLRETLQIRRRALPAGHPDVALSLQNLSRLLRRQGRLPEADALAREALELRRAALAPDHPDVAQSINSLALLAMAQHNFQEAETLFREALATYRKSLPPTHPDIAVVVGNVSIALQRQGRYADAEPIAREALSLVQRSLPAGHVDIAEAQDNLATVLFAQGKFTEAEPLHRETVAALQLALGAENARVGHARMGLGRTLAARERREEAEAALLEAQRVLSSAPGASARSRDMTAAALSDLYQSWDKIEPGRGYDVKARQWRQTLPATRAATTRAAPG